VRQVSLLRSKQESEIPKMQDRSPHLLVHELHPEAEQEEGDHRPADPTLVDAVRRLEAHERAHEDAHLAQARQRLH
jgi:hypothetical protein